MTIDTEAEMLAATGQGATRRAFVESAHPRRPDGEFADKPGGGEAEVAKLLKSAAAAERDAASEFPGSYYRKAHKARARRLRAKAAKLTAETRKPARPPHPWLPFQAGDTVSTPAGGLGVVVKTGAKASDVNVRGTVYTIDNNKIFETTAP